MKRTLAALGLTLGLAHATSAPAAISEPVRIQTGLAAGAPAADPGITVFHGLPYAAAPVGDLRWKPPATPTPWEGVRKFDQLGTVCPQPGAANGRTISEDCLNLDLWTAAASSTERRPVMVWFHGGGGGMGVGTGPQYDGENLAKKGVVVVTLNFRAGPLGHLSTAALDKESGHNASGNYGIMDAVAALQWVKQNISAFGGDPNNVTLFGQSFGSGTEHFITLSPLSKGLFQKVIYQSHARYPRDPELQWIGSNYRTKAQALTDGAIYEKALGTSDLAAMRAMPWQKLMEAYTATAREGSLAGRDTQGIDWLYIVDGYVVPKGYAASYAQGVHTDAAVMAGNNHDEAGASPDTAFDLFASGKKASVAFPAIDTLDRYRKDSRTKYGPMYGEFMRLYPATNDREAFLATSAATRDNNRMSTWMWATAWKQKNTRPAFLYFWTHAPPGPNHDLAGASHGSEIPYVFNNKRNAPWTTDDVKIADQMSSYWTNFARTGNPNGPGLPAWPAFDGKSDQLMEVGDRFQPIPLADKAKVDFWRRFYATQIAR